MSRTGKSRADLVLCGILTLLACLLWISADSFWIDEGNAAFKATQNTIGAWYSALVDSGGSDAQMPGFMLYGWLWEKLFGNSEIGLRTCNLPWYFLALWWMRGNRLEMLALALSPFVLYYMNEFRPYMMLIAGGALAVSGLRLLGQNLPTAWRRILGGSLVLCAASLIGVLWAAGAMVAAVIMRPDILTSKGCWRDNAVVSLIFAGLGGYYLKSLLMGQGAAALSGGLLVSVGACVYELMGLLGLGPSRVELRMNPASVKDHVVPLAAATLVATVTWLAGAVGFWKSRFARSGPALVVGIGLPLGVLVALLFLKDFRLLARHLAPVAVLLAILTANALAGCGLVGKWKRVAQVCAALTLVMGLASAVSARFCARHHKDDYRQAAQIARTARVSGRPVMWAADAPTGIYYGLRFDRHDAPNGCVLWDQDESIAFAGDETVILTKPDLYDPRGVLRAALKRAGLVIVNEIPAFSVWRAP